MDKVKHQLLGADYQAVINIAKAADVSVDDLMLAALGRPGASEAAEKAAGPVRLLFEGKTVAWPKPRQAPAREHDAELEAHRVAAKQKSRAAEEEKRAAAQRASNERVVAARAARTKARAELEASRQAPPTIHTEDPIATADAGPEVHEKQRRRRD